jgi:hypothetical protein
MVRASFVLVIYQSFLAIWLANWFYRGKTERIAPQRQSIHRPSACLDVALFFLLFFLGPTKSDVSMAPVMRSTWGRRVTGCREREGINLKLRREILYRFICAAPRLIVCLEGWF